MKIYRSTSEIKAFKNPVITTGTFDGVHCGHKKLLQRIKSLSQNCRGESVIITFSPHPRFVIHPDDISLKTLTTVDEKIGLLHNEGVDVLVILPFTKEFSLMSASSYLENFLVKYFHPEIIVTGYNHQFGHHRDGNTEMLRKFAPIYKYKVEEISKQLVDDISVSSTRIRVALTEGDLQLANHLLGYPYSLSGTVVHGQHIGNKIGFPTANIIINETEKLIPADGVYAVKVRTEKSVYNGMMNIGYRPTIDGLHHKMEVHLIDFSGDLYGRLLKIDFIARLRDEIKFESLEELQKQIEADKIIAIETLKMFYEN